MSARDEVVALPIRFRAALNAPGLERPVQSFHSTFGQAEAWALRTIEALPDGVSVLIYEMEEKLRSTVTKQPAAAEAKKKG